MQPLPLRKLREYSSIKAVQSARDYWALIKSLQTGLLLITGVAGFASASPERLFTPLLAAMLCSSALAISGCTVLNMVYDRDIDAGMRRTARRPLPAVRIPMLNATVLGATLAACGLAWAFRLNLLYGSIGFAGFFLNLVIYTIWLKRRTPFAVILGGMAGGMPILAGRTLVLGRIDGISLLLAMGVLMWIPSHNLTISLLHAAEYEQAGLPTFPGIIGIPATRALIACSTIGTVGIMLWTGYLIQLGQPHQVMLALLGAGLIGMTVANLLKPGKTLNFSLYKGASIYMLLSMLSIIIGR